MEKKTKIILSILTACAIFASVSYPIGIGILVSHANPTNEIITSQSGFKYETGIRIIEDGETVKNKTFIDIPIGIAVWGSMAIIENCTFINCSDEGIVFFEMSHNNTVRNCVFYQCVDGIEMQSSSNNTFWNCDFIKNSHAGVDAIHGSNNNNDFCNCGFYDNYMGIYSYDSYSNRIINCDFNGNIIDTINRRY